MEETHRRLRTSDWESSVGEQVRELRLRAKKSQRVLARDANVSVSAVQSLESGGGSSLATLVAVLRALGRQDWLGQLAPPVTVSPMAMLRESRRAAAASPKRAPRTSIQKPVVS